MKDSANSNPWKTLEVREVYKNPWIKVEEHDVINPSGGRSIYGKVCFLNRAIGIVPVDEKMNTWLVGQHRYTLDEFSWEIPEGGSPLSQDRLGSAKRELREETGITAARWTELIKFHTSNSVTDEVAYIYMAEDLQFGPSQTEETEADLIVRKLPLHEALSLALNGGITDSMSVIALLTVARLKGI